MVLLAPRGRANAPAKESSRLKPGAALAGKAAVVAVIGLFAGTVTGKAKQTGGGYWRRAPARQGGGSTVKTSRESSPSARVSWPLPIDDRAGGDRL